MGVVGMRSRSEIATGWRTIVLLAVLLGIGGGTALTALAGARRADTAMPRVVTYTRPDDGSVLFGDDPFSPPPVAGAAASSLAPPPYAQAVVRLPQVTAYFRKLYLFLAAEPRDTPLGNINVFGTPDASLFRTVDRPIVVAGRLPDPHRPFEVAVNELAAAKAHLHPGTSARFTAFSAAQMAGGGLTSGVSTAVQGQGPAGPSFVLHVTGVIRLPVDVSAIGPIVARQQVSYEGQENLFTTPALLPRLADGLGIPVQQLPVMNFYGFRLRHGAADWPAFAASATRLSSRAHVQTGVDQAGDAFGTTAAAASAQRGIRLEVVALLLFGALAALVTLLLVGQALARQVTARVGDWATLRSLGAARRHMVGIALAPTAVAAGAGSASALLVAILASPIMPLGLARQAEIHPGFDADLAVLVPGALALGVLLVARVALPATRAIRAAARPSDSAGQSRRASRVVQALARSSAPPTTILGVQAGLAPGSGRHAVPVVSAVAGAIGAVAALVAALTFGASLDHLIATPSQQGWNWDVLVGNPNDTSDREAQAGALLARNRLVDAYSAVAVIGPVTVGRTQVPLLAFDILRGSVHPPLLAGRAPRAVDEIVLASKTMAALHTQIGASVEMATPAGPIAERVVGRMISPSIGDLLTNGLGEGGWVPGALVRHLASAAGQQVGPPVAFNLFAVRYAPGASPSAAFASLRHDFGATVLRQLPATDAVDLQSVDGLPLVLSGLVVLLGVATVGNTLVVSIRRRRQDLAVLKTLGFVRRQVSATVAWQATVFAVLSVVVGLPLGLAAGRWAWTLVAGGIGSVSPPLIPASAVAVVAVAALVVCNLVAGLPARAAGRLAPMTALRSE